MKENQKNAYVTFVMKNDSFVSGALVLAYGLLKQCVHADLVCLVTKDVSETAVQCLEEVYTHVIQVDEIYVKHPNLKGRGDRSSLFTRFQALRLGADGDLGCQYSKIVLIDADVLPIKKYDELFDVSTPAGIINEHKSHWLGKYSTKEGKTVWHQVYEDVCAHGQPIPKEITDKVLLDKNNLGVNACLWVLEPSMREYETIRNQLKLTKVKEMIARFNWPEMQFATCFWSGQWHNIDIRYCAYNSMPHVSKVYGTHYAGFKPWHDKDRKMLYRYLQYDDYQLWYNELYEMSMYVYPKILALPRIKRIIKVYNRIKRQNVS